MVTTSIVTNLEIVSMRILIDRLTISPMEKVSANLKYFKLRAIPLEIFSFPQPKS